MTIHAGRGRSFGHMNRRSQGGDRVSALRTVSSMNRMADNLQAIGAAFTGWAATQPMPIGSAPVKTFVPVFNFWAIAGSGSNAITALGNTGTIEEAWIIYNGVSVQIKWAGSTTLAWTDGQYDVVADTINVSDFGVATAPVGAVPLLLTRGTVSVVNGKVPSWNVDHNRYTAAAQAIAFDPVATTLTKGAASWSSSGTAPTTLARLPCPAILCGRFLSASEPATFLHYGDSMGAGNYDVNYTGYVKPRGAYQRALYGDGTSGPGGHLAGILCAINGGKVDPLTATTNRPAVLSIVKYASTIYTWHLLNQFPTALAANAFPTGESAMRTLFLNSYANVRGAASVEAGAKPLKILDCAGSPRISAASISGASPDFAALAAASQAVYGPQWDLGGDAQKLNDWKISTVGTTGPDALVYFDSLVRANASSANADFYKFADSYNTDLVHWGWSAYTPATNPATVLRAAMLAL